MKKEEQIICKLMYDFTDKNWSKINKKKCEISKSKVKFLNEVKSNVETALWVFTEVCNWGMDKEYLKELYVELPDNCDFRVIKIDNKYIKLEWVDNEYKANFCKPKKKTVFYFD